MQRRVNLVKLFGCLAALIAGFAPPLAAAQKTVRVSLVLTCDIYEMTEQNGRGGFARLAAVLKAQRARAKHVIVAHAGDAISPSLFSGFDKGAHVIDLTNMLGLDVFVPGNHEFDFGEAIYRKRMAEARFSVLAANLRDAEGKKLAGHQDTKIFVFDGVKIGVIGITADNSPAKSSPGSLKFEPGVPTVKRLAARLRAEGADIVVAVAHAGRRQDLRIFYSNAVDILLSGDDHDLVLLYDGQTVMVEAKAEAEYVVAIDLEIELVEKAGAARKVKWWPRFRIIDTADVTPDPQVAARVAAYQALVAKELDVTIGKTATRMDSRKPSVRSGEAAIGNLLADAMRGRFGADVALTNGGGIRGNRIYNAGSVITRRHILSELPFGNKLFVVEMAGADLRDALENGLRFVGKPHGRFLHVSGLKVKVRAAALPGKRITSLTVGGAPLDPGKLYKVATNSFIAAGKEGFDVFKKARVIIGEVDGPLIANVLMSYIRKKGTVSPKVEGRIVLE